MTELQYLILKVYYNRPKINTYEFKETFLRGKTQYTKEQVARELSYLNESEFLESTKGEHNTLSITQTGRTKFELEQRAMELRMRWKNQPPFPDDLPFLPAKKAGGYFPFLRLFKKNSPIANSIPALKEKQQNAIVSFILKFWLLFLLPVIIGIILLAIENRWFK